MRFGERLRQLRQVKKLTLRGLAEKIGVGFTYLSKVKNEKLDFADYPSTPLICKLAAALDADEDELLLLAEKIPEAIKKRVRLLVVKTRQVDRLRAFYKALGVELAEEQHGSGPVHYAGKIGDAVLEIYPLPDEGGAADATTRIGFAVDRLVEVVHALHEAGTVIESEPRQTAWGLRAVVRDPDGCG